MKHRRSAAVFLAVLLTENRQPELGDTVTYTVGISQNSGFCAGTFFFKPSDNLTYVPGSAVLLGNLQEDRVAEGENAGAYGLIYLEKSDYTSKSDSFCSVSFIVSGLGDISVEFYAYQLINSKLADVPYTVTPGKSLTDTVKTPEKPVIKTESLPDGILNMQYDFMVEADRDRRRHRAHDGGGAARQRIDGALHHALGQRRSGQGYGSHRHRPRPERPGGSNH